MQAPPPPPSSQGGLELQLLEQKSPYLAQETNSLEQLFRREEQQNALPSLTSQRRSSAGAEMKVNELQRRLLRPDKKDGFWGLVQGRGPEKETMASMREELEQLQMREELEQLLLLERQQKQQKQQQTNLRTLQQSSQGWGGARHVSPLVTNLGASGMKQVTPKTYSPTPTTPGTGVVDILVPKDQDTGFFGVGSSLSFSSAPKPNPAQDSLALGSLPSASSRQGQLYARTSQTGDSWQNSIINSVPSVNSDQVSQVTGFWPSYSAGHPAVPGPRRRPKHCLPAADSGWYPPSPGTSRSNCWDTPAYVDGRAADSFGTTNQRP